MPRFCRGVLAAGLCRNPLGGMPHTATSTMPHTVRAPHGACPTPSPHTVRAPHQATSTTAHTGTRRGTDGARQPQRHDRPVLATSGNTHDRSSSRDPSGAPHLCARETTGVYGRLAPAERPPLRPPAPWGSPGVQVERHQWRSTRATTGRLPSPPHTPVEPGGGRQGGGATRRGLREEVASRRESVSARARACAACCVNSAV